MTDKKKYVILIVMICIVFLHIPLKNAGLSFIGYYDEMLAIYPFFYVLFEKKLVIPISKKSVNILIVLLGYVIIGIISAFISKLQNIKYVISDMFLCIKFWLILLTGYWAFRNFNLEIYVKQLYNFLEKLVYVLFILFIVDRVFCIFPQGGNRYGISSTQLFFEHPSTYGTMCITLIGIVAGLYNYDLNKKKSIKVWVILSVMALFSLRTKTIVTVAIFWGMFIVIFLGKKNMNFFSIILIGLAGILMAWDQIYFYYFSSIQGDSARYQLLIKSFEIAKDYFPFGSGFATFATYIASIHYSPLYYRYGLNMVNGLGPEGHFLCDSFWPAIIAEVGLFGTICYLLAILFLIKKIQKIKKYNASIYFSCMFLLLNMLILSIAEAAFFHSNAALTALWIGIILGQVKDK